MQASTHAIPHPDLHEAHHEEAGFWSKYIFSTDHKIIGLQYGLTALGFLFFGFCLMLMMRWQIAHPGQPVPLVGPLLESLLGSTMAAKGVISPDLYNSFGAMHGTIMVFLAIVPLAFAAFGNYLVPLQIGAPDMAFPRINMASYQVYVVGGIIMVTSFFMPGARNWMMVARKLTAPSSDEVMRKTMPMIQKVWPSPGKEVARGE